MNTFKTEIEQLAYSHSLELPNDIETIPQLREFIEKVCQPLGLDSKTLNQIHLSLEEAVVNVMDYAYPAGEYGTVRIQVDENDERLKFTITDSGLPFDPTDRPEVDINTPAEERPIGGLGIHLIRHYMDSVNYKRMDSKNILTLQKKL